MLQNPSNFNQHPPQGRFGDPNLKLLLVSSHLWHVENDGMLLALLKGFMDLRSVMVIAFHIYTIRTDDAVSHFFLLSKFRWKKCPSPPC